MTFPQPTLQISLSLGDAIGSAWHVAGTSTALGALTLGPTALAHRVGTFVGFRLWAAGQVKRITAADRALAVLDDGQQWYSATREADPFGAAQFLLSLHDTLRAAGWDGRPLAGSPRLRAISALRGAELPPGHADAVHALIALLQQRAPSVVFHIDLQAPRAEFSPLTQSLLAALEAHGSTVTDVAAPVASAPAHSDLGRLQRALLGGTKAELQNDGTVRILQGEGPWEAAALATATLGDDALWLLSGEGDLLDRVRDRFDRPRLGVSASSRWLPALQVLPLVLALQAAPQSPQAALELLTLPVSVVPRRVRRALVNALGNQPAVGSPSWIKALSEALTAQGEAFPDTDIAALTARINLWFPPSPPEHIGPHTAAVVCEAVASWARARGAVTNDSIFLAASTVAADLAESLRQLPADRSLDWLQLSQLHALSIGDGVSANQATQAGAPPVTESPDCIPSGVEHLVWFGLVAGNAEAPRDTPWSVAEQNTLANAGVRVPAQGEHRSREQAAWLHAVFAPTTSLTLVSWSSTGGEASEPHPLLDLWATRIHGGADTLQALTTTAREVLSRVDDPIVRAVEQAPAVAPVAVWNLPSKLLSTDRRWSASSIEKLVTCPMSWVFSYAAGLRPGATNTLPDIRSLSGTFGHALFETVLFEDVPGWEALTSEFARQRLHAAYDARVLTEAAPLAMPERRGTSQRLRQQLGDAIAELVSQLRAGGWRPLAAEAKVSELGGTLGGQPMSGSIDLLVIRGDGRRGIIDLKLGGAAYRARSLQDGTSIQLAVYARAASSGTSPLPPVAYFILESGEMITTDAIAFPAARVVEGPTPGATWLDLERAWSWSEELVRGGHVIARGEHILNVVNGEDLTEVAGNEPPEHPWTNAKPPCRYCDAQRFCKFARKEGAA